jgi:hypothetical protein
VRDGCGSCPQCLGVSFYLASEHGHMYTTAQHRAEWNIVLELGKHVTSTLLALVQNIISPLAHHTSSLRTHRQIL